MFDRLENELTILERHLRVLEAVDEHEPVGVVTLTNRLSYPRHKIRYSLRILEAEDLLTSTPAGVTTTDQIADFQLQATHQLETLAHRLAQLIPELSPPQGVPSESASAD